MSQFLVKNRQSGLIGSPVAYPRAEVPIWPALVKALATGSILVVSLLAADWIAGLAIIVLIVAWRILSPRKMSPVIAAAFTTQWLQVTVGILYFALTGRAVYTMTNSNYRPMVLLGMAAIAILFAGFAITAGVNRGTGSAREVETPLPFSTGQIAFAYGVAFIFSGAVPAFAWSAQGFTQALLVLPRIRYVLLFLLVTRLLKPKPRLPEIGALLLLELAVGFTGYFAEFREPIMVCTIAIIGGMDRRKFATWALVGAVAGLALGASVLWTVIKPTVRKTYSAQTSTANRLNAAITVASRSFTPNSASLSTRTDTLVSRIWSVLYPALALQRVPSIVPYQGGAILRSAIDNVVEPRMLFPDKPEIASPSEEVRKFAGVGVRGREFRTSIAFGYVGESYVDFGIPWMFLPIFAYGLLMGLAYRWLSAKMIQVELRKGVILVVFLSILGSYETSWVMMIGPAITILVVLGGMAVMFDRLVVGKRTGREPRTPLSVDSANTFYRRPYRRKSLTASAL